MMDTRIILQLSAHFLLTYSFSLEQITPPDDHPVCPGEPLIYECVATLGALSWQEDGKPVLFKDYEPVNTSKTANRFLFKLTAKNQSVFISTATLVSANSSDAGIRIECREDITDPMVKNVTVADGPASCLGTVSCLLFDPSSIVISLNDMTNLMCVESYQFLLGEKKIISKVDQSYAVFETDGILGSPYPNQTVYTLDAEGRSGQDPCFFTIAEPNGLQGMNITQCCNGSEVMLDITFEKPSFPSESCLKADEVNWTYSVAINNAEVLVSEIHDQGMLIHDVQQAALEIVVTPIVPDLDLSGIPFSTSTVLSDVCEPTLTMDKTAVVEPSVKDGIVTPVSELSPDIDKSMTVFYESSSVVENGSTAVSAVLGTFLFIACAVIVIMIVAVIIMYLYLKKKGKVELRNLQIYLGNPLKDKPGNLPIELNQSSK